MFKLLRFLLIFMISGIVFGQGSSAIDDLILQGKAQIHAATNVWDMQQMMAARGLFERLLTDDTYPWLVHYYIARADETLSHMFLAQENKDQAKSFLDDGIEHLEQAVTIKEDFAEAYALMSSLMGNKIGLNPILGMTLGMKSGSMMGKAFGLAPENPRVSLIAGQSAYYTPKMFGGGKDKALEHIEKALTLFETFEPASPVDPSWGHADAYAYLGLIQMDAGDLDTAEISFQQALEIDPEHGWVKHQLMGQLEEKKAAATEE